MSRVRSFCLAALVLLSGAWVHAAEISTNGIGGGPWSDPATWRGNKVPGPLDDVIIQKFDVVTFDRGDGDKISCQKLQIDPRGMLAFKAGAGKQICSVADAIESFGIIKLDGTKSASDNLELRMVGTTLEKRKINLGKGAGLLLYGRANLQGGRCNVALSSPKMPEQKEDLISLIDVDGFVSIDWQRAYLNDIKLQAKKIDNTGAKQNERLNFIENRFTGQGRLWLQYCDTPVIAKNSFEYTSEKPIDEAAINVSYSPLAEIKNNTVRGGFPIGISVTSQSDSVLTGNTVEKCTIGISAFGIPNTMIKQCVIRCCESGIRLDGATGVVEDSLVEGANTAYYQQGGDLQVTNFRIEGVAGTASPVFLDTGNLTLLNCNIQPDQFKLSPQPATIKGDSVTCLEYAIVGVKGAPTDCLVEVRTATPALPVDAADPNVRNTPAPLRAGLTPLPKTLNPLIVKAWTIDLKGKLQAGPAYTIKVLGPSAKEGDARPLLKMLPYRPSENAFRALPDDVTPTLEVKLK